MITPEEFTKRMKEITEQKDSYNGPIHEEMDALMCVVLKELGYRDGVKIFLEYSKWYE